MVKPPKTMQPEAVDLKKAGRDVTKSFAEDSFHNYMARKIDMQRNQFGLMLPPPPTPNLPIHKETAVRFASDTLDHHTSRKKRKTKKFGISSVLKRLKKKHGRNGRMLIDETDLGANHLDHAPLHNTQKDSPLHHQLATEGSKNRRTDLFFMGVVVLVNGYTNPDTDTIQRMLHRHGGDLERYETSRVTHIIAEQLSTAKAKMYMRQRSPRPVCKPSWIVDSVEAGKLLLSSLYIIDEMKDLSSAGVKSVADFFQKTTDDATPPSGSENKVVSHSVVVGYQKTTDGSVPECGNAMVATDKFSHHGVNGTITTRHATVTNTASSTNAAPVERFINGQVRTTGTDPKFLESFFSASRLSFIGSYKQRAKQSPGAKIDHGRDSTDTFVFHVDMDCFFAAVVLRKFPEHRNKPVVISHHGTSAGQSSFPQGRHVPKDSSSECATCNYEARKFGIKKGMFLGRAKTLCPNLVVLQYDFDGYEEVSAIVADILDRHAACYDGYVEQVSCDEAYVELHISNDGKLSSHSIVTELAETIRKEIFDSTQCTASIGVASNKLLSKLATDHVKPNRSFVVQNDKCKTLLRTLMLRDLHGVGYRMERKLVSEQLVSVEDVWELGESAENELCRILGAGLGKKIYGYCQGVDKRPIQPAERKTIGAECNYGVRFGDGPYGVDYMVAGLCKEVEKRMNNVGVKGSKLTLKVKQRKAGAKPPPKYLGHGSCHNLSKSAGIGSSGGATSEWNRLYEVASTLLAEMKIDSNDIRGMGVVVSKLDNLKSNDVGASKQSITNWFSGCAAGGDAEIARMPSGDIGSVPTDECERTDDANHFDSTSTDSFEVLQNQEIDNCSADMCEVLDDHPTVEQGTPDEEDDIALPYSLSQIHMSQVEELPTQMQNRILSKMNERRESIPTTIRVEPSVDVRYRQTNVKRLFQLASFKSDARDPCRTESVSLTQLEKLPLELQLQVANNDQRRVGLLSSSPKKSSVISRPTSKAEKYEQVKRRSPTTVRRPVIKVDNAIITSVKEDDPRDFYYDNVKPVNAFMNDNPDAGSQAQHQIVEFLFVCISEERLVDVTCLLRTIRSRSDLWGTDEVFDVIFERVDAKLNSCYGFGASLYI